MCSPWWPLSAIESLVKSKLPTTNYLSPWQVHKIDGDSSETLRMSMSNLSCFGPEHAACIIDDYVFNLTCSQIVHVLIVICVHNLLLLFLAALIATVTCMHVSSCMQSHMLCARALAWGRCLHHWWWHVIQSGTCPNCACTHCTTKYSVYIAYSYCSWLHWLLLLFACM